MSSIPPKNNTHSWSVATFETHRKPLTDFLKTRILPLLDAAECRRILIRAPVKSGKREMVEYLAVRDLAHCPQRVHAFISAFHRVADQDQRNELKIHNMEVFSIVKRAQADHANTWIVAQIAAGKQVVLHIDECDFGAGEKQILGKVYKKFRLTSQVTTILYSATPQEVLFSGEVEEDETDTEMIDDLFNEGERVEYTPPESFRGPAHFLDAGLVSEAQPFFYKTDDGLDLSEQGRQIVELLRTNVAERNGRNIAVLRLSYSDLGGSRSQRKENKAIYQFLQGWQSILDLSDFIVIVDKGEKDVPSSVEPQKIKWSSRAYWDLLTESRPILLVIDQTSSRSTEWKCHHRVCASHDFRNTIVFSTISQAQERVNHYTGAYGGFQPIRVYGHMKTFLLSAGRITYPEYMHMEWEKRKIDRRTADSDIALYQIRNTSDHETHPSYPTPLPLAEADRALQELGCFAEIKVSARVGGTVRRVRSYEAVFYPCTKLTFSALCGRLQREAVIRRDFQNPFERSEREGLAEDGKYKGYLRGWQVFDFERDIVTQAGWGVGPDEPRVTVCYRGTELGVALRYDTGLFNEVNTLETRKSMYNA
jgi:hypothetical protein